MKLSLKSLVVGYPWGHRAKVASLCCPRHARVSLTNAYAMEWYPTKAMKVLVKTVQRIKLRQSAHCGSGGVSLPGWLLLLLIVTALSPSNGFAQAEPEDDSGPLLLSVSPLTGQPGRTFKVEARGNRLEGVSAVWIGNSGFKGEILSVEEVKDQVKQRLRPSQQEKKPVAVYRVLIDLQIEATTRSGVYPLRLVSHRGVSNPIDFPVVDAPLTVETPGPHQTIDQSQPVALPGFISGKIGEPGEVDTYSFQVRKGQRFQFEAVEGQKFDAGTVSKFAPELALYRASGSWFDPQRPARVLFDEERSSDLMHVDPGGTYRFSEDGRYFLQVSGLFGQGCPDCTYQVRVFSCEGPCGVIARYEPTHSDWSERSLSRSLGDSWIADLHARSVAGPEAASPQEQLSSQAGGVGSPAEPAPKQRHTLSRPVTVVEREPNDRAAQSANTSVPAVIEGTIGYPGDVDSFKFKVDPGQKLAFEVETLEAQPPYFNPRVGVVDSQDHELFSNVERRLSMYNNNADPQVYLKAVRPKATYSFERGGEYLLQVRDITSRYGNPSHRYRILVRPQIPHVGEISVISRENIDATPEAVKRSEINRINLVRREPKKLILVASYEEGFTGDLSFFFTGLPEGVQAFPAVHFNEGRAPLEVTQSPDIIAAKEQRTAIVLLASAETALTSEPRTVQLRCQAIANGKLGANLLVREIPLMVVEGSAQKEGEKPQPGE